MLCKSTTGTLLSSCTWQLLLLLSYYYLPSSPHLGTGTGTEIGNKAQEYDMYFVTWRIWYAISSKKREGDDIHHNIWRVKKLENLRKAKCATVKRSKETRCKHQRKTQFLHSIPYSYPMAKITSLACHHSWWFISCVSTTVFILVRPVISPTHIRQDHLSLV